MDPDQSSDQNASEQATEAPGVATSGADNQATADVANQNQAEQGDPSQLAADGDAVVGGLEENHVNPVTPDEGQ